MSTLRTSPFYGVKGTEFKEYVGSGSYAHQQGCKRFGLPSQRNPWSTRVVPSSWFYMQRPIIGCFCFLKKCCPALYSMFLLDVGWCLAGISEQVVSRNREESQECAGIRGKGLGIRVDSSHPQGTAGRPGSLTRLPGISQNLCFHPCFMPDSAGPWPLSVFSLFACCIDAFEDLHW